MERNLQQLEKEKTDNQEELLKVVMDRGKAETSGKELIFNPATGEFEVVSIDDVNQLDPDSVVITEIADNGWA